MSRAIALPLVWVAGLAGLQLYQSHGAPWVALAGAGLALLLGGVWAAFSSRQLVSVARAYEQAISQSEQSARALRQSEQRLQAIIDGARDAMLVADDAGVLVDANPAALELTGRTREDLLGRSLLELAEGAPGPEGRRARGELRLLRPDGTVRHAEYHATANFLPGRHLSVVRDITLRKQQEEEIRLLNESLERRVRDRTAQLEEANRELESFSYSVSHDLRSPLRHIHGFSDLLRRSATAQMNDVSARYLETISDSAKRASQLVDELLSFSRMGRAELRQGWVEMVRLVEEVRTEVERDAEQRELVWKIGKLPMVRGDAAMLRQVLRNLLSNAVKYTRPRERAEISVDCRVERDEFVFEVRDNGVGFDMEYAHRLFGVFKRLHRDDEFEGTGIGLANVRRIIQRHGGRTWAEAKKGEGAAFYFSLPAEAPRRKEGSP